MYSSGLKVATLSAEFRSGVRASHLFDPMYNSRSFPEVMFFSEIFWSLFCSFGELGYGGIFV